MLTPREKARRAPLFLFSVLGLLALVPALNASSLQCGQDTLAAYLQQGSCTIGDYTLKNFTFDSAGTGDINLVSASQIIVDPTGSTLTNISLEFSTAGGFTAAAGQTAQYVIHYNLDPFFPSIGGASIDLGPNDPVTLIGQFCGDGVLTSTPGAPETACTGTAPTGIFPATLRLVGTGDPSSTSLKFPILVTTLDTRLTLNLDGPASVNSFGVQTSVTNTPPVPEPSSSLILIPGFAAVAWFRKRRHAACLN